MRTHVALVLTVGLLAFAPILPAWAESSPAPGQPALDQVIEQYIRSHPEVIEQALQSLEVKRQRDGKLRVRQVIATHQEELLRDPASPVSKYIAEKLGSLASKQTEHSKPQETFVTGTSLTTS